MTDGPIFSNFSDFVLESSLLLIVSQFHGAHLSNAQGIFIDQLQKHKCDLTSPQFELSPIRQHVALAQKVTSYRALPFLTSEISESLTQLKEELFESWSSLLSGHPKLGSYSRCADVHACEKIDSLLLTFLEWIEDVQFLAASSSEQSFYLTEFPFEKLEGVS